MSSGEATVGGPARRFRKFVARVLVKFDHDDAVFLAAAIAWGVLFALIPLLTLGIGLTGFVLSARFDDPTDAVVSLFATGLPQAGGGVDFSALLQALVGGVMEQATGLTVVGSVVFVWVATRLAGSLRIATRQVFEIDRKRGVVTGKLFDVGVVLIGIVLVTTNIGVTVLYSAVLDFGVDVFDWGGRTFSVAERFLGYAVPLTSIWALFLLTYRYVPARRIPWGTALRAATITAVAHEGLKYGFSWYATEVANYGSTLGNLATVAVLFFWIYYESLVFILGGEVAHVYMTGKANRGGV